MTNDEGKSGAVAGIIWAFGGDAFIGRRMLIANEPGLNLAPDAAVLIFALLCSVLTGIVFGTVPAWIASRSDVNNALKESSRGTTSSRSQNRLRHTLIIGEVPKLGVDEMPGSYADVLKITALKQGAQL